MQKKMVAWSRTFPRAGQGGQENQSAQLLRLLYEISTEVFMNPQLYETKDHTLWVYYEHTSFEAEALFAEYGEAIAQVSQSYPVSIYGNVEDMEGGELTARLTADQKSIQYTKRDISATDFDGITDICLKIVLGDGETAHFFSKLISSLDFHKPYVAMERTAFFERVFSDCPQYRADTYFRYLPLTEEADAFYLHSLTVDARKQLWMLFLENGLSPIEFDDGWKALQEGKSAAFPWELALRLALSELEIAICYENQEFKVWNAKGERLLFDYDGVRSAEKMFLKLLFPNEPGQAVL